MISFTHHNIRLDDGTFTKPEIGFLTSEFAWFLAAKRAIEVTFQDGMAGKRIVDLGCLEGGYTVEFARMGFDALGIEVRKNNFAACEYVRAHLALQTCTSPEMMFGILKNTASSMRYFVLACCIISIGLSNSLR
jgi:2-polyprenyl-3-methyl-5-hydroxy-6-metoxy-1,4-benzoquinol methylase